MTFFTSAYEHFAPQQILVLLVFLAGGILIWKSFGLKSTEVQERMLKVFSLIPAFLEILRDCIFMVEGTFKVGYLPLHLCGHAIIAELIHGRMKEGKAKDVLSELLFTLFLPGACAALLFPDWNDIYPLLSYYSFSGYTTHFFLVLYVLLLYGSGRIHLNAKHCWYGIAYLLAAAAVLYPVNRILNTNFLFENEPTAPFDGIWYRYGFAAYAAVFLCAGIGMVLLMYLIDALMKKGTR